jgi:hypothetical protein
MVASRTLIVEASRSRARNRGDARNRTCGALRVFKEAVTFFCLISQLNEDYPEDLVRRPTSAAHSLHHRMWNIWNYPQRQARIYLKFPLCTSDQTACTQHNTATCNATALDISFLFGLCTQIFLFCQALSLVHAYSLQTSWPPRTRKGLPAVATCDTIMRQLMKLQAHQVSRGMTSPCA